MEDLEQPVINNLADNWRALAFLSANYQGRFAALNILGQLNSVEFKKTELNETKELLQNLVGLVNVIKSGKSIFFPSEQEQDELDHKELDSKQTLLLEISEQLKTDLFERATKTKQYLKIAPSSDNLKEAQFLLSSLGWYAYSRDNYIRAMIDIGEFAKNPDWIDSFKALQQESSEEVKLVNDFLKNIKKPQENRQIFYEHLWFFCRTLPGVFHANCHDINLLLSFKAPEFTYADAGFNSDEEVSWQAAGFDPQTAGYWKAYDFTPERALQCLQVSLIDPKVAADWNASGFSPDIAVDWLKFQFNPLLAIQWFNSGYQADQAAFLLSKGIHYPTQIRQDQVPALVKEYEEIKKSRTRSEEEAWFGKGEDEEDDNS